MKRNRVRILSLLVCLCVVAPLRSDTAAPREAFFPVSVWYGGGTARAPMLEPVRPDSEKRWRADVQKIKDLGFNTVRTWIDWSAAEPRQGEYRFEQLELLLRLAEEAGLRVIVQVYVDSAPDWVGGKYPDAHFVAQNGQAIPSQAAPGFCFDHPGVRAAVLDFYREAARRVARSPAFHAWDLWSEPHVINWAIIDFIPNASFCFCPHTLARFRASLQEKYGSLERLNEAWYRRFRDWQQVEPPRFGTILSYADYMDWRLFITDKLAEDLAMRSAAVKEILPGKITTSHAAVPSVFTSLSQGDGTPDGFLMAKAVDYWGTSMYPKHSRPAWHWSLTRRALAMDFTAAMGGGRGFYVGELQAGFGTRGVVVSEPITAADLELYTWGMVARGAVAVNYYAFYPMSSGYEAGGYGLIHLDGTLTERSRRAGETARKVAGNADLLLAAQPEPAEAAILFTHMATLVGGEQHSGDRGAMRDATAGYHRMFFERNLRVDFLNARDLQAEQLRQYKLVIVPYPILMTAPVAGALRDYVRGGGRLFSEARPGWVDERGYAQPIIPGFGWHDVFGVRETSVTPRDEVRLRWAEAEVPGADLEERFEVLSRQARPIAFFADGSPAAYEHDHGKGRAMILGTFAGQINEKQAMAMNPLGDILAQWAGLTRPVLRSSQPVELRRMQAPAGQLVLLFNHGKEAAEVEYAAGLERPASVVREIVTGEVGRATGDKLELRLTLPAESVRVFRIEYR